LLPVCFSQELTTLTVLNWLNAFVHHPRAWLVWIAALPGATDSFSALPLTSESNKTIAIISEYVLAELKQHM
jgi:hypothetical protein